MKKGKEKIDVLLQRNVDGQLDRVDWDELGATISRRLNQGQQSKTSGIRFPTIFKIAAGVAAAAAVVIIAVMIRIDKPRTERFESTGRAEVNFIESKGSASVEIEHASAKAAAVVELGGSRRKVAKCDIKIIDAGVDKEKNGSQAAWIIIRVPEPVLADDGISRDKNDFACLL
jgi:YD repeat-containing protein